MTQKNISKKISPYFKKYNQRKIKMCYLFDWKDFYLSNWRQIWPRKKDKSLS